ncbi:hypothetical protein E4T56_gene15324 [Termitomyces sp. T112]|nr:hypothetical protein E4T56_gene15324 [Termitomyces sp. T112]
MEGASSALGKPVVVRTEGVSVSFIGELEVSNPGGGEEAGGNTLFQKPETGAPVRQSSRLAEKLKTAVQHNVIVDSPLQSKGIEGRNRDTVIVEQVPVQAKKMNKQDNKQNNPEISQGRMLRSMIWDYREPLEKEYLGVRTFAQRMKLAIMKAHDSVIAARWTPVKEQPSWHNISIDYPDDDAINNLEYILGTFVDPISCQYSKDFANKCLLAYHMSINLHAKVTALKDKVKRLEEAPVTRGRYNPYGPIYGKSKKISKKQTAYSTGESMNVDAGSSGMTPLVKDMGLGK